MPEFLGQRTRKQEVVGEFLARYLWILAADIVCFHTRVTNLYDLMDSAYDAPEIRAHSASMGHVAIIDVNPRSTARKRQLTAEAKAQRSLGHVSCERLCYRERSTVERVNGRLKDDFGGRQVRVRGHAKVLCHLMFGILALTVAQLVRLLA